EGYTDTIALHQAGFTNTVATLGTALTAQHLLLLARFTEQVVLLFDGDAAGQRAADRALGLIESALAQQQSNSRQADILVALLPGTLDPADFIASAGAAALQEVINQAQPLIRYSLDRTLQRFDLAWPEQRSRAEAAALQVLLPLRKTALASNYLHYLADYFNLTELAEAELRQRFDKLPAPRRNSATSSRETTAEAALSGPTADLSNSPAAAVSMASGGLPRQAPSPAVAVASSSQEQRIIALERELLFLFIEHPELRDQLLSALADNQWWGPVHSELAQTLCSLAQIRPVLSNTQMLTKLAQAIPQAASTLSSARLREYDAIAPARLADQLLLDIREQKLLAAIDRLNGQRRRLTAADSQNDQLFRQLVPLQQELAALRKSRRGTSVL
ncbi:MAG: toprim domain-containing protein, partial [Actinomycetia bacterium]|nr:toprim domain-containing protein [Actinomycetes bacterium]